jgi:predicted RNA binding protein YcfA (HicA-like mRNA interferase family)
VNGFGRAIRDMLAAAGCTFLRHGKGDHDIWSSPISGRTFTVPVSIQSRHTANKILKDAALPKAF